MDIYAKGTFQEFMKKLDDPEDTINLLDIPIENGERPSIIKLLAADVHSWNMTAMLGATSHKNVPKPNPLKNAPRSAGSSVAQSLKSGDEQSGRIMDEYGPAFKEADLTTWRHWALAAGHAFYTYPHYDASGLCTWTMITEGMKVWSYLVPKDQGVGGMLSASKISVELANAAGPSQYNKASTTMPKMANLHNLFLTPGSLL